MTPRQHNLALRPPKKRITSFDSAAKGSGNVANEVVVLYDGFGQATDTYQSHSGAVNLSTTPSVQMAYADGSANTVRPTGLIYPDGRDVTYDYGAADSIHEQCSLVSSLIDSDTGATHLADYQYLGLGAVVLQDSPQADLRYTLVSLTGSNDPDTGDIYAGLDRFGRVKDLRWRSRDTGSDLSRVLYGYDRASSRIWRENPSESSRRYDWLYGYDSLHRLHSAERGELYSGHTSITSPQFGQCWTLDPTGNWHGFRQDDDGNRTGDLIQARTSNPVNEITDIDNTTGPSWVTPTYDANGNMTTIPRPDLGTDKAMTATWDAWNRLAKLVDPDTSDTLAEYSHDGRNFGIVGKSFARGTLDETRHFFFTDSWQCLEERIDSSSDPERQHVWGIRYIDDLVLRDRDTTGNGTLDERLYFLPDANWNVTAVVDDSGAVQERIEYTPYGYPNSSRPRSAPEPLCSGLCLNLNFRTSHRPFPTGFPGSDVIQGTDRADHETLRVAMKQSLSNRGEELMPTLAEQWANQGREQGLAEGMELGIEKGIERGALIGAIETCRSILGAPSGSEGLARQPLEELRQLAQQLQSQVRERMAGK